MKLWKFLNLLTNLFSLICLSFANLYIFVKSNGQLLSLDVISNVSIEPSGCFKFFLKLFLIITLSRMIKDYNEEKVLEEEINRIYAILEENK